MLQAAAEALNLKLLFISTISSDWLFRPMNYNITIDRSPTKFEKKIL